MAEDTRYEEDERNSSSVVKQAICDNCGSDVVKGRCLVCGLCST